MAAQTFIRWSRLGVWEKLLALVQERQSVELGMVYLDRTTIRAQSKAAGACKRGAQERSGTVVKRLAALVAALGPKPA